VTLGYEPQWLLVKNASAGSTQWMLFDNMRGMPVSGNQAYLLANTSGAEVGTEGNFAAPNATGFTLTSASDWVNGSGNTMIYIAIRRGPMKVPTTGTSVFAPVAQSGNATVSTGFPVDLILSRPKASSATVDVDRLRGARPSLLTNTTDAETLNTTDLFSIDSNVGYRDNIWGVDSVYWNFRRAPGTFDEVCYTGNGTTLTVNHNLGAAPELIITKRRSVSHPWYVTSQYMPAGPFVQTLMLDSVNGVSGTTNVVSGTVNQSSFTVESAGNGSGETHVAYLWATNPGVTKVGTYTGNGSSQTINCGFTSGARFVMIKAVSTTGNWAVADSARGIVAGNDPALYLNSAAAEITGFDWIDADSTGFIVNETATIAANTNGVQYIYLSYA
jgi:hypothetical protein